MTGDVLSLLFSGVVLTGNIRSIKGPNRAFSKRRKEHVTVIIVFCVSQVLVNSNEKSADFLMGNPISIGPPCFTEDQLAPK